MAYPVFASNVKSSRSTSDTSHTVRLPSSINLNELILVAFAVDGLTNDITWDNTTVGTWTTLIANGGFGSQTWQIHYKVADGTEDDANLVITTANTGDFAAVAFRITGTATSSMLQNTAINSGSNNAPNSLVITPSWDSTTTNTTIMSIMMIGGTASESVTAYPAGYTANDSINSGDASSSVLIGWGLKEITTASEDPGAFTHSGAARSWDARTIAIKSLPEGFGTIYNVGGENNYVTTGQIGVIANGTSLGTGTSARINVGSRSITMNTYSADATAPTFNVPALSHFITNNIKFVGNADFQILNVTNTIIANTTISIRPESDYETHNVSNIANASDSYCIYNGQSPAIAINDQFLYDTGTTVNIDILGYPELFSGTLSFNYYVFDASDETWGSFGSYSAGTSGTTVVRFYSNNSLQAAQFLETGVYSGPATVMRIYSNSSLQMGTIVEQPGATNMRLYANGTLVAAQFIEV